MRPEPPKPVFGAPAGLLGLPGPPGPFGGPPVAFGAEPLCGPLPKATAFACSRFRSFIKYIKPPTKTNISNQKMGLLKIELAPELPAASPELLPN